MTAQTTQNKPEMVQKEKKKEVTLKKKHFLNLFINLGPKKPDSYQAALTRIKNTLKIEIPNEITVDNSSVYDISYELKNNYDYITFKDFSIWGSKISGNIMPFSEGSVVIDYVPITIDTDNETIEIVVEEHKLLDHIQTLTKTRVVEETTIIYCKGIFQTCKISKKDDFVFVEIPKIKPEFQSKLASIYNEIESLSKKKYKKNIVVYFHKDNSNKSNTFSRFDYFKPNDLGKYIFVKAEILTPPVSQYQKTDIDEFDHVVLFSLKDGKGHRWQYEEIDNSQYLKNLKIKSFTNVLIQGVLEIRETQPIISYQYLEIMEEPPKITKAFVERTRKRLKDGEKKEYEKYHINEPNGIWEKIFDIKSNFYTKEVQITRRPIKLKEIFVRNEALKTPDTVDETMFYKVQIAESEILGEYEYIMTKCKKIRWFIKDMTLLPTAIMNIMSEMMEKEEFTKQPVFTWCGIHTNKEYNFVNVIPQTYQIMPLNEKQIETVNLITNLNDNIIIPKETYLKIDKQNILNSLENYLELWQFQGIGDFFKLMLFGFPIPACFYKTLSEKKSMDVYPCAWAVGKGGTGKTSNWRLMLNFFWGIEEVLGSKIDSKSRLRDIISHGTYPILIEEIDVIKDNPKIVAVLKAIMTALGTDEYKKPDNTWVKTDLNSMFVATSNDKELLKKDDAFKEGRVLLSNHQRDATFIDFTAEFEKIEEKIKNGKIIGHVMLSETIKYIQNFKTEYNEKFKKQITNELDALIKILKDFKKKVMDLCNKHKILLSDSRRRTLYAYLLFGLTIWDYVFRKYIPEKENSISSIISFESDIFVNFIKDFEDQNLEEKLSKFEGLIQFLEKNNYFLDESKPYVKIKGNCLALSNDCLGAYHKYAKERNYYIWKSHATLIDDLEEVSRGSNFNPNRRHRFQKNGRQIRLAEIHFDHLYGLKLSEVMKQNSANPKSLIKDELTVEHSYKQAIYNYFIQHFEKSNENLSRIKIYEKFGMVKGMNSDAINQYLDDLMVEKKIIAKKDGFRLFTT